ncbi:MAG: OmpH family outer membrane protein [Phycisphaeraceae bacterium JB051]
MIISVKIKFSMRVMVRELEMRYLLGMVLSMCLLIALGCEQDSQTNQAGNMAVVDMDQIAMSTGFDKMLGEQMMQINAQISTHLKEAQDKIRQNLEARQQSLGENPTDQQKADFEQFSYEMDQQYRQELNKAQQASNQAHTSMIGQFRQKITPIAQNIARERGFDVVMTRTDAMLLVAPAADITQDVLALFNQSGLGNMSIQPRSMQNLNPPPSTPSPMPASPMLQPQPESQGQTGTPEKPSATPAE